MKIISFDGYNFATNNYYGAMDAGTARGQWSVLPQIRSRHNAAGSLTGVQISERAIPVIFGYTGPDTRETAFLRLLGQINPANPYVRTLVAQLNSGATVQCEAVVTLPGGTTVDSDVDLLMVTFVTTDPYWTAASVRTSGTTSWKGTASWVASVTNTGQAHVPARIDLKIGAQSAANFNYLPVTVTNNTALNWYRELVFVDIGDTRSASGFSTSAANCNVYVEGVQQPRIVINYGTPRTYLAIPVTIAAGQSRVYEVVTNRSAGDSDAIAFDFANNHMNNPGVFKGFYTPVFIDGDSGTATAATGTTLSDTTKAWRTVGGWAGAFVEIVGGTGAGQCRRIASNTATQITVARAWSTTPTTSSVYCIHTTGWLVDGGQGTATATTTTLTDSSQSWDADSLVGGTLTIIGGTGNGQSRTITANTANGLTFTPALSAAPDATTVYVVRKHGYHQYNVDQTDGGSYSYGPAGTAAYRHGAWQVSGRTSYPSRVAFGGDCVAGWRRVTYLDNRDDYTQLRWTKYSVAAGTRYSGLLNATRRRGQDTRLLEEGTGDGVAISSALGFQGARFDYRHQNINGVGKFTLSVREAGSENWADVIEDTTARATLTSVAVQYRSFSDFGTPTQLYMGALPKDGIEIPTTQAATDQIVVQWNSTLRLYLNAASVSITPATAETRVRVGGEILCQGGFGGSPRVLRLGKTAGADRELFMRNDNLHTLRITSETGAVETLSPAASAPWAVRALAGGRTTPVWLVLPPGTFGPSGSGFWADGSVVFTWFDRYFG